MRRQALIVSFGIALLTSAPVGLPPGQAVMRFGLDLLMPFVRMTGIGLPPPSRVAVLAIDEETYRTPPFAHTPKVAWTPEIGLVIDGIAAADAAAIGLDLVFPTTLDSDDLLRNYDRKLLQSLLKVGRQQSKLVLGEIALSDDRVEPTAQQQRAVGAGNLRLLNHLLDGDDVVRRYPVAWPGDNGSPISSFGAELAARAGGMVPNETFVIRGEPRDGAIPTYSFADIHACIEAGKTDFMRKAFEGRVVLIGEALDVEDRRLGVTRFAADGRPTRPTERCATDDRPAPNGLARTTIPGVYLHAMAIDTILSGSAPRLLPPLASIALGTIFAGLVGIAAALLTPFLGSIAIILAGAGLFGASLIGYGAGWVIPYLWLIPASMLTAFGVYGWRFVVEDREKRRVQRAFRHYLSPALVDRLASDPAALKLGGERRRVAVFFSDIAGFTSVSEKLRDEPEKLVAILNAYTTVIADCIEARGGYIDKFIGDSVMAMWNAPLADHQADYHAMAAALDCLERLDRFNREVLIGQYGLPAIGTRIGINSGVAIAGNMGSARRLNYTVTGDVVNLAARLESANKAYGTTILVGEETARGAKRDFLLRRVDRTVVKGKSLPVKIYELVAWSARASDEQRSRVSRFHSALGLFLKRRFVEAEQAFEALASRDETASVYRERARLYVENPPPKRWDRAWALESK
jgi:adenylate cyclase